MIPALVRQGRDAAARLLLVDECAVRRGGGGSVFDPETGDYVPVSGTEVYAGPCRVRPAAAGNQVVEAGGEPVTLRAYVASLPVDAPAFEVDDLLTVTSSTDPLLVDRPMRVTSAAVGTTAVVRRVYLEAAL